MISKTIHFIHLQKNSSVVSDLSFHNYLAVKTAAKVNQPKKILFHLNYNPPNGFWWNKVMELVELNQVSPPSEIFGIPLENYAHKADVMRLEILKKYGGIYLDIDIISINPFDELLENEFVLGREENTGLCNAVILAEKSSPFLNQWYQEYKNFESSSWNFHSVKLPLKLALRNPELIKIVDEYSFFYPVYDEIVSKYLWNNSSLLMGERIKDVKRKIKTIRYFGHNYVSPGFILHSLRSFEWHYNKLRKSYCVHLWESIWGDEYLTKITPQWLLNSNGILALLISDILGRDFLIELNHEFEKWL